MMSENNAVFLTPCCAAVFLSLADPTATSVLVLAASAISSAVLSHLFLKIIVLMRGGSNLQTAVICFTVSSVLYPLLSAVSNVTPFAGGEAVCGICSFFICISAAVRNRYSFTLTCVFFAISALLAGILRELISEGSFFGKKLPLAENLTVRIFTGTGGALLIYAVVIGSVRFLMNVTVSGGGRKND